MIGERRQPHTRIPPESFHLGPLTNPLHGGCRRRYWWHDSPLEGHAFPRRFGQRHQLDVLHAGAPLVAGTGVHSTGGLAGAFLGGCRRFADGTGSRGYIGYILGVASGGGHSGVGPPRDVGCLAVHRNRHSQVGAVGGLF